jgi:dephospho-CoA kinase
LIFADADTKQWLNDLMHPAIREQMLLELKQAQSDYCILVAPLLFENKLERFADTTLVIDVPEQVQLARTIERDNVNQQQVENIIKSQVSRAERLEKADDVIDNDQPLTGVYQQIGQLHAKYVALSKKKS